jgi:hypothetical protein
MASRTIAERSAGWYRLSPSPDALATFLGSKLYAALDQPSAVTGAAPLRLMLQLQDPQRGAWAGLSRRLESPLGAASSSSSETSDTWHSLLEMGCRQLLALAEAEVELCEGGEDPCSPEHAQRVRQAVVDLREVVCTWSARETQIFRDEPDRILVKKLEPALMQLVDATFPLPEGAIDLGVADARATAREKMAWSRAMATAFRGDLALQSQALFSFDVVQALRSRRRAMRRALEQLRGEESHHDAEKALAREIDLENATEHLRRLRILLRTYFFLLAEASRAAERPSPTL